MTVPVNGGGGAPQWPGAAAIPGSKAAFTWLVANSGGLQSGKTVLDVTMPGTGLHRVLYTNQNGDYPSPPAAPVGVQVDKGPPEQIAGCGLPLHVTGGGGGFMAISLTSPNVNGGLVDCTPSGGALDVNLEAGGTGASGPFYGAGPATEAAVQLNFAGQPSDGELFTVTTPLGAGLVHFYINNGGGFMPPSTGVWVNIAPSLAEQVKAVDLPVNWTVTIVNGMPGSTTISADARATGTAHNGGTIETDYPGATINGAGSPGAFAGGITDVPAVPPAPYPVGTANQITAPRSGESAPHTSPITLGTFNGFLKRTGAGTDGDAITPAGIVSSDIGDFATAAGAVASAERAKMETVDEVITCDGTAKVLDPALRTSRLAITANGSALSLADGTRGGQRKLIIVESNANNMDTATLTPAHAAGWTSLAFTATGYTDWAVLEWQARGWTFCEHSNVTPF